MTRGRPRPRVLPSVVDAIGETPVVDLARLAGGEGRVLAKLEYLNPGASKKDRIARQILDDAIERGALAPGQTIVEMTSGNTGTGLDEEAMVAARRLARREGIFAGLSSGANVAAALKLIEGPLRGGTVAVILADSGLKYLSTELWP